VQNDPACSGEPVKSVSVAMHLPGRADVPQPVVLNSDLEFGPREIDSRDESHVVIDGELRLRPRNAGGDKSHPKPAFLRRPSPFVGEPKRAKKSLAASIAGAPVGVHLQLGAKDEARSEHPIDEHHGLRKVQPLCNVPACSDGIGHRHLAQPPDLVLEEIRSRMNDETVDWAEPAGPRHDDLDRVIWLSQTCPVNGGRRSAGDGTPGRDHERRSRETSESMRLRQCRVGVDPAKQPTPRRAPQGVLRGLWTTKSS